LNNTRCWGALWLAQDTKQLLFLE